MMEKKRKIERKENDIWKEISFEDSSLKEGDIVRVFDEENAIVSFDNKFEYKVIRKTYKNEEGINTIEVE